MKYDVGLLCRMARALEEAAVKHGPSDAELLLHLHDEVVLPLCLAACGRKGCSGSCASLPDVLNPGPHLAGRHTIHRCRHHWAVEYTGEPPEPLTYPDVSDT